MRKQLWQLFKCVNNNNFCQQYYKRWNSGKIEKFTWNKFSKVFIRIPGTSRSYRHTNKSSFDFDITRFFLQREITRNVSCRGKFFNPKMCSQVFRTNPIYFFHYLPFYFRLNKTGKILDRNRQKSVSEQTEIYRQNSFGDITLHIYNILKMQNWTKLLPWKLKGNYKIFLLKQPFSCNLR